MFYHTRAELYSSTSEGCTPVWLQLSCFYGIKYKHCTGALQKSWQLGCVWYQVSRELCYQTAACMKAKSLCFKRLQTKHQEKPCTLSSKAYGSRWFGPKCFTCQGLCQGCDSSKTDNSCIQTGVTPTTASPSQRTEIVQNKELLILIKIILVLYWELCHQPV